MAELEATLENKGRSAPGNDSTTYEIIKNCPKQFKHKILTLFNEVWETGTIPKSSQSKSQGKTQKTQLRIDQYH